MTRFEFKPDKKKSGRNQLIGSWTESACKEIDLPFTKESMIKVLQWGIDSASATYTHQEIAHWCDKFHLTSEACDVKIDPAVIDVAADIDAQWDMYLPNTYNLDQLQNLDYSQVKMPKEWFSEWLESIKT